MKKLIYAVLIIGIVTLFIEPGIGVMIVMIAGIIFSFEVKRIKFNAAKFQIAHQKKLKSENMQIEEKNQG